MRRRAADRERFILPTLKLGVFAATGGIALVYLMSIILGFFRTGIPYIHESGLIGIGFSLFVVVIAALNLVVDFDSSNRAPNGAPEVYGIVRSLRLDGDADLAVYRDPPPPGQNAQPEIGVAASRNVSLRVLRNNKFITLSTRCNTPRLE